MADSQDFSKERIKAVGIARRFRNDELDNYLQVIYTYIKQENGSADS